LGAANQQKLPISRSFCEKELEACEFAAPARLARGRRIRYPCDMQLPGIRASYLALALALGCGPQRTEKSSVFGGEGARVMDEKPLPAGAGDAGALGPCGKPSPATDAALLDDFEDGNDRLFKAFERDGFWFGASDDTQGSKLSPTGTFQAELLPDAESTKDNRFAAHLSASGQTNWGVVWGSSVQWTREGIKCPVNLSAFAGLRFRAKGPGQIRVSLAVPEVTPSEGGGTCADRCYDAHSKRFVLGSAWDTYDMRWEKMAQGGWGKEARFTPERVVNVGFHVDVKDLPIDFWLDDVQLIPRSTPAAAAH
jgi:hypothetical protein